MAPFSKRLKWWLRDLWMFLAREKPELEPKTVCAFSCRECGRRHRWNVQVIGFDGIDLSEIMPASLTVKCPTTGEAVRPAQQDFVFLTEREADLGRE
jgi:hypothetical protein